ncbi:MAG: hypothetical protein KJO05_06465 [Bacteroidia bacterium]|nr:hypothetical protein [Bacteroidia bacterium]MBT8275683.1 hypothetical protein [Bacteroidia bacterium]NNF30416.1 hypothetical protein [Flavobacteriaceae bacterium]NNK54326.1 hypothetical protein [Flavobacteriaceae bacterium]NNM08817.1 hypothetical protein [Flavobacteriaceae bacterium]
MNSTIKKLALILTTSFLLSGCLIQDPKPEDCVTKEITVTAIEEGTSFDIVIKEKKDDFYYINRGLEQGLTIEGLKEQIMNKKVNLQLYKFWFGTSEHISQLTVDNNVLFTEFD